MLQYSLTKMETSYRKTFSPVAIGETVVMQVASKEAH